MTANKLKLNGSKTEFIIIGTQQGLGKLPQMDLRVADSVIKSSACVRNLGTMFDTHLSMTPHINSMISSINYQLRNIRRIRRFLDQKTLHTIVLALVISRLDSGNALLYGAKSTDLDRLQSLQHKAAKLIFYATRLDSPTPLMHNLHWLPVRERIKFKLCLYVYKCLHDSAPSYLTELVSYRTRSSSGPVTRSSNDTTLLNSFIGNTCSGDKSFRAAGPALWNCLPRNIREACSVSVFKKLLKAHYYPHWIFALFILFFSFSCALISLEKHSTNPCTCMYVCM